MDIKILSNNIRRIRLAHEYTQENVANDLNISLTSYGRIELGKTDIAYSRLQQIADYFGVETEELFRRAEFPENMNDSQEYKHKKKDIQVMQKDVDKMKIELKQVKNYLSEWSRKPIDWKDYTKTIN